MQFSPGKYFVLIIMLIALSAPRIFAKVGHGDLEKVVDGVTISLSFMDEDAHLGTNSAIISLMDAGHNAIERARVTVVAEMSGTMEDRGHSEMKPPVLLQAEPQGDHDKGQYMAMINLSDEGKWKITVKVSTEGEERSADFAIEVMHAGPDWKIILGFLAINTVIIVAAAINRKKKNRSLPNG